MDANELKGKLEALESKLKGLSNDEAKSVFNEFEREIKGSIDNATTQVSKDMEAKMADALKAAKESNIEELKAIQDHLNKLDVRTKNVGGNPDSSDLEFTRAESIAKYNKELRASLQERHDEIKGVSKSKSLSMEVKVMTLGANLTGDSVATYQGGIAAIPSQRVNFADLVPAVSSATGTYILYREGAPTGVPAAQTEGAAKAEIDFNPIEVVYNASYIAGFTRFSKQMATDLPFLQSFLPGALRREYFKVENATFQTALIAGATKATNLLTTGIERIISDIGGVMAIDHDVNGIVLNPVDWAEIANTKPSDFSLPRTVDYVNGQLVVLGVPVYTASWATAGQYIVGDWNMAKKVVVSGLAVEFFEQDSDNVQKNLITSRVEQRTVLAIDRPEAFVYGNLTGAQPV